MAHLHYVMKATAGADKKERLRALYAQPAPYVGPYELPRSTFSTLKAKRDHLKFLERMQPCNPRGHIKPKFDSVQSIKQTVPGIVFTPEALMNIPSRLPEDKRARDHLLYFGEFQRKSGLDLYNLIRSLCDELAALDIQAHGPLIDDSHVDANKQRSVTYYQRVVFVPHARLEYLDGNPDLPIESHMGHQAERFLAYLLVKNFLDPQDHAHRDIIRDTFLIADVYEHERVQRFMQEISAALKKFESVVDTKTWPQYDPELTYGD